MTATGGNFSLFDLWRVCRSQRWAFLAAFLAVFVLFAAYAVLKTPVYRAEVVVLPSEGIASSNFPSALGGLSGLGVLAGLVPRESGSVEAVATLESGAFLRKFIDSMQVMPILFEESWDSAANSWRSDLDERDIPTMPQAVQLFRECCLVINEDTSSQITTVAIEWHDPSIAASWANQLIVDLNSDLQKRDIAEAESMITYLEAELEKTNVVGLQQAIFGLIEQQVQRKTFARVRTEFAYRIVDPAIVPEEDDFIRPNRPLLALTGLVGGLLVGIFVALFLNHIHVLRAREQAG
ncbi:MAG: Wzz/FepE/Etk N-terminal domain-containing protein [Woeseiaceae bacterium]|nr:Wzz/FepE/Etk N-terminal domain-containing protein [Woeseiaceae bacterium]